MTVSGTGASAMPGRAAAAASSRTRPAIPPHPDPRQGTGIDTTPPTEPAAIIVLVTASWCLPCRPAPVLQRELDRRLRRSGAPICSLRLDDPSDAELEAWGIEALPTWIRFERSASASDGPPDPARTPVASHPEPHAPTEPTPGEAGATSSEEEPSPRAEKSASSEDSGAITPDAQHGGPALLSAVDSQRFVPPGDDEDISPTTNAAVGLPAGEWTEARRLVGAAPKHEVHADLYELLESL